MEKNFKCLTAWDEVSAIKAVIKQDGKKKMLTIRDWDWYFAMTVKDFNLVNSAVWRKYQSLRIITKIESGPEYVKIHCNRNTTVFEQRSSYSVKTLQKSILYYKARPLEIDLPIFKHWLHHENIQIETDLSILFFDIETDDTIGNIEIGRDRILSFAACDDKGKKYFISDPDEKVLLEQAIKLIRSYDVISGWSTARFDLPYIQKRMEIHELKYEWKKTLHVDMMLRLIKLFASISGLLGLTGFSLNEVSRVFLKDSKVAHKEKIIDMYHNNFELLKEYNLKDVELLYKLNEKISILPLMIKECEWTGTFLNQFYIGEILDNYIIRDALKHGKFIKSKPTWEEVEQYKSINIRGGYVMTPKPDLYENVRVFDFKSMYPSIIISWNIGEDSLNEELSRNGNINFNKFVNNRKIEEININEIALFLESQKILLDPDDENFQAANNVFFHKNKQSLIPDLVSNLLEQRKSYKKKLDDLQIDTDEYRTARATQEVVKEMANSIFGITADKNSRYFNIQICEAITLTGQFLVRMSIELAKRRGVEAKYGDTDSFFLSIQDDDYAMKFDELLNDDIQNFLKDFFHIEKSIVFLEYEKKFSKLIMVSKKKYTGRLTWMDGKKTDVIFSRGVETVKKDTIGYTKKHITRLIEMLVKEEASLETCKTWLEERKKEVETIEMDPRDISITVRISKSPERYAVDTVQVRVARDMIKKGLLQNIVSGKTNAARITYIVTDATNKQKGVEISDYAGGMVPSF